MDESSINRIVAEFAAQYPPLITLEQAACIAQNDISTIHDWSSRGKFTGFKIGVWKSVRLDRDLYVRWLLNGQK